MGIFTEDDYNSNDGMLTTVWGPPTWFSLHNISFNYPVEPSDEVKKWHYMYWISLGNVLPCGACRENFKKNLKILPLTDERLKNRESFSRYVYEFHELVNKALGKESGLSYQDIRDRYEGFRARCISENKTEITDKKETGCTVPLYGKKSKTSLLIVPREEKYIDFAIHPECKLKKL